VDTSKKNKLPFEHIRGFEVLKYLGEPAIIKDFEISNLKIIINTVEEVELIDQIDLKEGEDSEVTNGTFFGLLGKNINVAGKYRVLAEVVTLKRFIIVIVLLKSGNTFLLACICVRSRFYFCY
jgi:transcription antitermination factor NusG